MIAKLWQAAGADLIIYAAILCAIVAIAAYVVGRIRGRTVAGDATDSDLMTDFRDLHSQGGLSDDEYRKIKSMLSDRLQRGAKDAGKTG